MRYIFNMLVTDTDYDIIYQDLEYSMDGTNRMGNVNFYTYHHEGSESLLITPTFLLQFEEAAKMLTPILSVTTSRAARIRLLNMFDNKVTESKFSDVEYEYVIRFKDVDLTLRLKNGKLTLTPFMHIFSEKLIDSRMDINVGEVPQLEYLFDEDALEG